MRDYAMQGLLRKLSKDTEIDNNIDYYDTIEGNLRRFKDKGLKLTKKRLLRFLEEYEIEMKTDKEVNYEKVITIYKIYPYYSSRKLETICKEYHINVSYRTIQKIIKDFKLNYE